MTPADKTKFKSFAQVRTLVLNPEIKEKLIDSEYYIEGYAATFERYLLFKAEDGEDVFEMFERNCFDNADMSDIVLHLNHGGHVFARTSNGTLIVQVREHGLFFAADLSKTESGRKMYEEIKTGNVRGCFVRGNIFTTRRQERLFTGRLKKFTTCPLSPFRRTREPR